MGRHLAPAAAGLYCLSLVLPALAVVQQPLLWGKPHDELLYGMHCVLLGFFVWPAWLANPLLLVAWLFYLLGGHKRERYVMAAWLSGVALVAATLSPWILTGNDMFRLRYMHVGFYVWLVGIACFVVASIARAREPILPLGATYRSV